eukprot:4962139-Heterocapsa_arctica.AAC.1
MRSEARRCVGVNEDQFGFQPSVRPMCCVERSPDHIAWTARMERLARNLTCCSCRHRHFGQWLNRFKSAIA